MRMGEDLNEKGCAQIIVEVRRARKCAGLRMTSFCELLEMSGSFAGWDNLATGGLSSTWDLLESRWCRRSAACVWHRPTRGAGCGLRSITLPSGRADVSIFHRVRK